MRKVIAIDFDGTLCEDKYPEIGEPEWYTILHAISEQRDGAVLILWTCRTGELLRQAVEACSEWGIDFDYINENDPERIQAYGGDCRKISADEYWDDKAVAT